MQLKQKITSLFAILSFTASVSLFANPLVEQVVEGTMPYLLAGQGKLALVQEEMLDAPEWFPQDVKEFKEHLHCTQVELEGLLARMAMVNPETVMSDQEAIAGIQHQLYRAQQCMNKIAYESIGRLVGGYCQCEFNVRALRKAVHDAKSYNRKKLKKRLKKAEARLPQERAYFESALKVASGPCVKDEVAKMKNQFELQDPERAAAFGSQFGMSDELKGLFGAYHTLATLAGEPSRSFLASALRNAPEGVTIQLIAQPQFEGLAALNLQDPQGKIFVLTDSMRSPVAPEHMGTDEVAITTLAMSDLYSPEYVRPNPLAKMAQRDLMSAALDFVNKRSGTLVISVESSEEAVLAFWQRAGRRLRTEDAQSRFQINVR